MLQQQDDRSHGNFRRKRREERRVDIGRTNVLETPGNGLEDLDWICALFALTMTGVQPRRKGQDDDHKGTAECRDEEKESCCAVTVRRGQ